MAFLGSVEEAIRAGMRQIERWLFAAGQDADARVKLLHANYAAGNIDMLRQQFNDADIKDVTGKSAEALARQAIRYQDEAQSELGIQL